MSSTTPWPTSRGQKSTSQLIAPKPLYPGLGLPLREYNRDDIFPIGAHGGCYAATTDPLPVREVAMMSVMESLTDKPDWHVKVYNEEIVAKWRAEALSIPNTHWWDLATSAKQQHWEADGYVNLIPDDADDWIEKSEEIMSATAVDCCIQELRSKAKYFEKTGMVPTLDARASVVKSDTLVSESLHESLLAAFRTLKADQADSPDWHPNSGDKVQNLVHPSLYPLVYRRSRVFQDEVVGVEDAITKWSGRGAIIPGEDEWVRQENERWAYGVGGDIPPNFWSVNYQWLPSNVAFQDDGSVRFTSYINNLHPTKYTDIYRTIERLIETSLPMWDQCLKVATSYKTVEGPGRTNGRFGVPTDPDDENASNWDPSDPKHCPDIEVDEEKLERVGWWEGYLEEEDGGKEMLAECKWKVLRKPVLPEPSFEEVNYEPQAGERLVDKFHKSGLQVIVKMASIELTPEKPHFPQGSWHVEGQMNEHICATALYYLDSENITTSSLSFRMQTSAYLNDEDTGFSVGRGNYHWMESVYATHLGCGTGGACLQNYGSVETRGKRLLAFPNVFQHRVSPFELDDPTKPGHRRFIALWLVDPHKRIISTANVPPQQLSWWAEALVGANTKSDIHGEPTTDLRPEIVSLLRENGAQLPPPASESKMPEELIAMVHERLSSDALPMSLEEAKGHRLKLMQERSAHVAKSERAWQQHSYSFCEH
ncbi:hypothetical protein BU25DRAFT_420802 [Macroventuria anomochaeta]|uniref:Uncharacterized protein n=1 Tax=Macroventuria anomochaeta TaxID=301207 RepID=A0ACB6S5B2_9PLEO|nr:uncharacterized protein BU25DRAFT_420802 [Macroventuria anomochaeta]KAF2628312.1 hypothetical protein BU25DRAFT_420802 [Macroventuria anomochaeta]